jgi:predicted N-acetyltransferase YhbS
MNDSFWIRAAHNADAPSVARLIRSAFTTHTVPGWSLAAIQSVVESNSEAAIAERLPNVALSRVASIEQRVAGYICFEKPHLLSIVAVDPSHQRQGVASALIEDAIAALDQTHPENEVLQLSATELSQPLYTKHGFYPISPMMNVAERRLVRMAKWLRPKRMGWTY